MLPRLAVIVVLGFIAYGSMLPSPFRIMDDRFSIIENPAIKSAENIPELFREGYFRDQSYYRPLVNLSFMAEWQAFGPDSFFYNLDNLILHILNAILVFLLAARLTNSASIGFWTGLLFVIHPVQWEAVCNVPGRSILLSAFFVLSSFVLFLEYYQNRRAFCLPLVALTFFFALLCKESAAVLPLVIAAYLLTDKSKSRLEKIQCLWPFFVAAGAYLFLRIHFSITAVHQHGRPWAVVLGFVTFLRSVITDLRLFLLPIDLHYDRSLPFMLSLKEPQAVGTCIFWVVAASALALGYRRIPPLILFLAGWFFIELLPVSQLVASIGVGEGHISTAEHFLYLAAVPVFTAMVTAFQGWYEFNARKSLLKPFLLKFLAGGFLVFFLLTAVEQSIYASNEYNMVRRSLVFEPGNARLQGEMGMLSVFRDDIPDAEMHFRAAIKADPFNPDYHISLGTALCQQSRWVEGLEQFVAFDPGKHKLLVERQEKLTMGHIREQMNEGKTFDARGWLAIGIYLAQTGESRQAVDAFLVSTEMNPGQADAWFDLGSVNETLHNWPAAGEAYRKLLALPGLTRFQRDFAAKRLRAMDNFR
jgi:tetratricopeptide (TPR) repeat protein